MSHRFADPSGNPHGFPGSQLRWVLSYLRENGFNLVSVGDIASAYLHDPNELTRAVAFTVDDGYDDFSMVAAPIFTEFDCPVTVFLPTGFIDRICWMWPDRILHAFEETERYSIELPELAGMSHLSWQSGHEARLAANRVVEAVKQVSDDQRRAIIDHIVQCLEVEEPRTIPERYAPMSWETIRRLEGRGVRFGPHTVTHPVLSRSTDDAAEWEMAHSWTRLQQELADPTPIFCYPNGRPEDVLPRDLQTARKIGMQAAVSTAALHVTPGGPEFRYFLPRLGIPYLPWQVRMYVQGLERAKAQARREPGAERFLAPSGA